MTKFLSRDHIVTRQRQRINAFRELLARDTFVVQPDRRHCRFRLAEIMVAARRIDDAKVTRPDQSSQNCRQQRHDTKKRS